MVEKDSNPQSDRTSGQLSTVDRQGTVSRSLQCVPLNCCPVLYGTRPSIPLEGWLESKSADSHTLIRYWSPCELLKSPCSPATWQVLACGTARYRWECKTVVGVRHKTYLIQSWRGWQSQSALKRRQLITAPDPWFSRPLGPSLVRQTDGWYRDAILLVGQLICQIYFLIYVVDFLQAWFYFIRAGIFIYNWIWFISSFREFHV